MNQFEAGKTYSLRGGGQGEIFVTKDGKHWGRMLTKHETDWHHAVPSSWDENGNRPFDETGKFTLIAPPTTVTRWVRIYEYGDISADLFYTQAEALRSVCDNLKAIPIHITTHANGKIEITGGSE